MRLLSIVSKKTKKTRMSGRTLDKKNKINENVNDENSNKKAKIDSKQFDLNKNLKESIYCYDNYGYGNYICNGKNECIVSNNKKDSCQCKCNCASLASNEIKR
jgi:hypothetical protein